MTLLAILVLLRTALVLCEQESLSVGRFFNPANAPEEPTLFSENVVWAAGDVQTIKFTTTYSNYTIALWQQNLAGGFALLGPVIFQTTTGAFPQFEWVIQTFDLDPSFSSVFFLWLHAGSSSDQGKAEPLSVTSAFFNITLAAESSSNSTATISTINSSNTASSTVTSASTSNALVTATSPAATITNQVTGSNSSDQPNGLSQGATVGVGVGVAFGALFAAIAAIVLCLRRNKASKRQNTDAERDAAVFDVPGDMTSIHKEIIDKGPGELYGQEVNRSHLHTVNRYPAELS